MKIEKMIKELSFFQEDKVIPISVDFDSTLITASYPSVGEPNGSCVSILKHWVETYNVGIILHTMRDKKPLEDAINWFKMYDIPLYGINDNPLQNKTSSSRKVYSILDIDDHNVGIPLMYDDKTNKVVVYWEEVNDIVEPMLKKIREKWN